jgi:hypothetical protein
LAILLSSQWHFASLVGSLSFLRSAQHIGKTAERKEMGKTKTKKPTDQAGPKAVRDNPTKGGLASGFLLVFHFSSFSFVFREGLSLPKVSGWPIIKEETPA